MMIEKIFNTEKPIIGMIHFSPTLGFEHFEGMDVIYEKAVLDLNALEKGGVDGIMIENNYDLPHKIFVGAETVASMTYLGTLLRSKTNLPMGINVLWNDYRAALSIAKVIGAQFVRIPVFVDNIKTDFGKIYGKPKKVIGYRKLIQADDIAIFTDIQVKHARMLESKDITVSAREAISQGSNSLIITGKWTGDAPQLEELRRVRKSVGNFPILIGSGADKKNVQILLELATGIIISTSLKERESLNSKIERNIKPHYYVVDVEKVKEFIKIVRGE
ncbi:MAG: BtpA/SgcQ family protein [Candidatus Kuenenbacteria bacterium]